MKLISLLAAATAAFAFTLPAAAADADAAGKVPLVPAYIEQLGASVLLRTPAGERIVLPNRSAAGCRRGAA